MTDDPMPSMEFKRGPCVKCGARTERQAETRCKPTQEIDGDYHCPGDFNEAGWSIVPTKAGLDRLDAWIKREIERLEHSDEQTAF